MNKKELFSNIINVLNEKYSIQSKLIPTYRYIDKNKSLYIILRYIKNTEYNIYETKDIFFSIEINENFPEVNPYIKTLTDFSFPSLNGNSNLFKSILNKDEDYLNNLKETDPISIFEQIIKKIPLFIKKVKNFEEEKKFLYLGEFIIDEIYDINDFFISKNIVFFRVELVIHKKYYKKYIILNDVYFLLFDPVPNSNNYGKLIAQIDILLLNKIKENKNGQIIKLKLIKDNNETIKLKFRFENKYKEFLANKESKIIKLIKTYNINLDNNTLIKGKKGLNETKSFILSKSFEADLIILNKEYQNNSSK